MTWTYSPTDLLPPGKDTVRFFVGDTDMTAPQLMDEEILFTLQYRGDVYSAASMCAWALCAKYSRLVSTSADGFSAQSQQKAVAYAALAKDLQSKAVIYALPYAGALSRADMRAILADPDRIPDLFRFGEWDNPPNDGVAPPNQPGGSYPTNLGGFNGGNDF